MQAKEGRTTLGMFQRRKLEHLLLHTLHNNKTIAFHFLVYSGTFVLTSFLLK